MPAQSRAQRRRANASGQRSPVAPKVYSGLETAPELPEYSDEVVAEPAASIAPATQSRVARRLRNRTALEPVDYTKDYRYAAKELQLIAIWAILLFVVMFGLYFARINGLF